MKLLKEWLDWWDKWTNSDNPTEVDDPPVDETRKFLIKQYDPTDPTRLYKETLFEMSVLIVALYNEADDLAENYWEISDGQNLLIETFENEGRAGLMDMAIKWTDEFEELHKGREWDGEWWDEIEKFVQAKVAFDFGLDEEE